MTLPVLCFSAAPFFGGAWRALRRRRIGMDVPVALGIGVAFITSSGAAFDPQGPFGQEVWFDSLTMFISFLLAGRCREMRARHCVEIALEDATDRLLQSVMRLDAQCAVEIFSARRLRPGDRVRVPLGQAFAVDGVLIDSTTSVYESLLPPANRVRCRGGWGMLSSPAA